MSGMQNKILYGEGIKITPTSNASLVNMQQDTTDVGRINYTGNPNGVISANPGSLCHDPVSGEVYRKSFGTSNIGWLTLGTDITLTGNSGGAISAVSNNFNLLTANSTVNFVGTAGTQTLDFGLGNLILGNDGSTITIGTDNTGFGRGLYGSLTSGGSNTFFGINLSGPMLLSTGSQNCGFGLNALAQISSGSNNNAFGYLAGTQYTGSDSGNIAINHIGVPGESNTIRIGSPGVGVSNQTRAFMAGITAVTVSGSAPVGIDTNGQFSSLGFGSSGNVLTSNGAATSPTYQSLASLGGITSITGSSGGAQVPSAGNFNILGAGSITSAGTANTETIQLTGLTNHALLVGAGTSTITKVGPSATTGQVLQSQGSSTDPAYSTATYPSTTTLNQLLYSSSANTVAGLATATNGVLITDNTTGIPSISSTLPSAVQGNITSLGTVTSGTWNATTIAVNHGGTGATTLTGLLTGNGTSAFTASAITLHDVLVGGSSNAVTSVAPSATVGIPLCSNGSSSDPSFTTALVAGGGTGLTSTTAYGLIAGGTTTTGAFQNTGAGTTGQYLKSNGSAALPAFAALPSQASIASVAVNTTISNVTGDGTLYFPIIFDTKFSDPGTNFSTGTGLFTAPTTGNYLINANITLSGVTTADTNGEIRIIINGSTFTRFMFDPGALITSGSVSFPVSFVANLTATNTVSIGVLVSGSTKSVSVQGNSGGYETTASFVFLG